ncbi:hypothetical protein NDU88_004689 [Pleurodeles waltl]|uniref:Uncharacterized protein n=1 Tax=Pleurodeles waltl TaxID=8319 RepID=A0AAV7RM95_PLEWA|nr:hypothetical protein NDU88_004689 [Pleurodeles waltl]
MKRWPIVPRVRGPTLTPHSAGPSHLRDRGGQGSSITPSTTRRGSHSRPLGARRPPLVPKGQGHVSPLWAVAPPDPVPPRPTATTGTCPAVAPSRALVGSTPYLHPRGRSAQPEPTAATPADRERVPGPEKLPPRRPLGLRTQLFRAPESSSRSPVLGGALADVSPGR